VARVGRAGSRSLVLSGDGRRGRELVCHPEVVRAELRKVDGGSEEGSPGSGALARKSPPAALLAVGGLCCCGGRGWLSVETREHQSLSFDPFCLLPPASCLLPRRRGWLAVSVETREHQSLSLFDLPSPARLACWRAVTRKCARRSEMKGGSVDRCIEASQ